MSLLFSGENAPACSTDVLNLYWYGWLQSLYRVWLLPLEQMWLTKMSNTLSPFCSSDSINIMPLIQWSNVMFCRTSRESMSLWTNYDRRWEEINTALRQDCMCILLSVPCAGKLLLTLIPDGVQNKCIHLLSGYRPCPKSVSFCACKDISSDRGVTTGVPIWLSVQDAIVILQDTYEFFSVWVDELKGICHGPHFCIL